MKMCLRKTGERGRKKKKRVLIKQHHKRFTIKEKGTTETVYVKRN